MSLHQTILDSQRGDREIEESERYPEGITPEQLSEVVLGSQAKFIFIPADLVPEARTSRRIIDSGQNLYSRYVVYSSFRRGVGHDSSYG